MNDASPPNGDAAQPSAAVRELLAGLDARNCPLGPQSAWPAALRHALALAFPAQAQIVLFWGPDYVAFYNDAYAPTIGDKHPRAFGRPAIENWRELWDDLEPLLGKVRDGGETVFAKDRPFYIERRGYGEEVFFDISYSPIVQDDGSAGGVLCIVGETTERVRYERKTEAERLRLSELFTQAPSFMAVVEGPDHRFTLANAAYAALIGRRELVGKTVRAALPELGDQGFFDLLDRVYATGEPHQGRGALVRLLDAPDGAMTERRVDFIYQPIKDRDGRVTGVFMEGSDVTEQFVAIEAQLETESRLRLATQAAAIGTWDYNPETDELRWDARCDALFAAPPGEPITYDGTFLPAIHPDDRERVAEAVRRATDPTGTGRYAIEYRIIGIENAVERWISAMGGSVFHGGRLVRFVGTVVEITERKRAEAALTASEAALRDESRALEILNRTASRVAAELDLNRLVQTVVDAGVEITGAAFGAFFYNVEDARGESYMLYALSGAPWEAFSKFPMPRNTEVFAPTFAGEGVVRSDDITKDPRFGKNTPHLGMPDGHLPVRSYLAASVISRSGAVIGGLFFGHAEAAVFDDRAERRIAGLAAQAAIGIDNARLFQAEQRLNRTLEQKVEERTRERDRIWRLSRDAFLVSDSEGRWIAVSPAWTEILGWAPQDLLGRTSEWMEHPDDREKTRDEISRLALGQSTLRFENRFRAKDGTYRTFSWTAVPEGDLLYCVARDVTAKKAAEAMLRETEDALRQAQKMETLGQLTGGVAHDFNNLLQIVTGNLDILLRNLPDDSARLKRAAGNAMTGAQRAATLTQRLLAFSRRQPLAPKQVDANRLLTAMAELLHRTLGETIEIQTARDAGLWPVEIDPNQLETAMLNLAINARDAMPDGGKLTIETSNALLDDDYVARHAEVTPGQYVVISVSDTGVGMSADVLARAFEPFFTTKEVGKGTGLGLSMVYGFVKQSGGHVKAYSEPGEGTTVRIYLPRFLGAAVEAAPVAAVVAPGGARGETILVCEDDEDVRSYSAGALTELGYRVIEAADGPAALDRLEAHQGRVDLLFTDVVLPGGMTGATLARQAKALRPGLKVLFTTGYARNAIVHHGRLDPGVELLTKPFTFADLAARVREILDSPPAPAT